ncbi:hypothetical protein HO133_000654 [Letharia lupina]|uniref:Condensation domain-containing protein n=1 Tax=Letharia lupina TaxID=560253 RepID=A0A8H6FBS4_9LECA|nr:uncharacterized protein HO133_000654 [Letharia lupina]KAF6222607.1 hypothetical protein HO133_000654 [Letharia lupina]
MDAGSPTTTNSRKEDTDKMIRACAEACGVGRQIIEKICPASEEQEHYMEHHISTGSSYMMQMVLHYEGDLNQNFLLRVLSAMRFKNHVLRTRLVKHEGHVYQVVLRDPIVFQQTGVDLHGFLAQNSRTRMDYGTPLSRYAFVREPHGEAFFVWTDLLAYSKLPPRPPYGKYAIWLASCVYEVGLTFWLTRHTTFDNLVHKFPVLGPGGTPSASTMKTKKLLHLPKVENPRFNLPTMGHAAWALTIAKFLTREYPPLVNEDISFISMSSARESDLPGIKRTMGPISARVPLLIRFLPDLSIENLMRDIETQLSSMIGFEHCAMKVLSREAGFQNMLKQAVFSWNPPDCDLSCKRIICYDKEAAPAVLDYREDLSVPFAHDYGLMFEVYEHGEHISIHATWDQNLVSGDLISRLLEDFGSFLALIIKTRGATVVELLSVNRVCQSGRTATFDPHFHLNTLLM